MTSIKPMEDPVLRRLIDDVGITFKALASYLREHLEIDEKEADEFYKTIVQGALSSTGNFWREKN